MHKIVIDKNFAEKFQKEGSHILLASWEVAEGQSFAAGGRLFCLETEKALFEVTAGQPGVVKKILLDQGALLDGDSILALIAGRADEPCPSLDAARQLAVFPTGMHEEE